MLSSLVTHTSLIKVLRVVNGKPEQVPILVKYTDNFPDATPTLTIGTDFRRCRTTRIVRPTSLETYTLEEFPTYDGVRKPETQGRAFHLVKNSTGEKYSVFVSTTGDEVIDSVKSLCVCTGFMHAGHCKHCGSLEYLVQSGVIADPRANVASDYVFPEMEF